MSWLKRLFDKFRRKPKGNQWDGFKAVDDIKIDTPEEFRDRNAV